MSSAPSVNVASSPLAHPYGTFPDKSCREGVVELDQLEVSPEERGAKKSSKLKSHLFSTDVATQRLAYSLSPFRYGVLLSLLAVLVFSLATAICVFLKNSRTSSGLRAVGVARADNIYSNNVSSTEAETHSAEHGMEQWQLMQQQQRKQEQQQQVSTSNVNLRSFI